MDFSSEISFKTSRSGGKGGQNVNKVETAVEALWPVNATRFFTAEERERILHKLAARINADGYLSVKASDTRSQLENKEIAVRKMHELVRRSLIVPKKRTATKPSAAAREKRLESKKRESQKKEMRRRPGME